MSNKQVNEVLEYLNGMTGRKFRNSTHDTQIKARIKEHGISQVKRVVEDKCEEWIGDKVMRKYLRPETLFRKSNFDKYLSVLDPEEDTTLTARQKEYNAYLKSIQWHSKRELVAKRANHTCEGCGEYQGNNGDVHHLSYNHFKNEFLFELIYLCRQCHERLHHSVA